MLQPRPITSVVDGYLRRKSENLRWSGIEVCSADAAECGIIFKSRDCESSNHVLGDDVSTLRRGSASSPGEGEVSRGSGVYVKVSPVG